MDKNMGTLDRTIRIVVGAVLLIIGLNTGFWLRWLLFVLAAVMFITSAIGFCPLYTLCKCSTTEKTTTASKKKTTTKKKQ